MTEFAVQTHLASIAKSCRSQATGYSRPEAEVASREPVNKISARIGAYLNAGDMVIAEVAASMPIERCFVSIRGIAKPGVPREARRFLNSTWKMWEYWDFKFRRMVLCAGWEGDEWNYDQYIVHDDRILTYDEAGFFAALQSWIPDPAMLEHHSESSSPE